MLCLTDNGPLTIVADPFDGAVQVANLRALRLRRRGGGEALCDPAGHVLQHRLSHLGEVVVESVVASFIDLRNKALKSNENDSERCLKSYSIPI